MLRSALFLTLLTGCAASTDAEPTWGELACEGRPQGHLETRTWCGDEWRSWHAEGQAASAGRIVDGVHQSAHTLWWPDGTVASQRDGAQVVAFNEGGTEVGRTAAAIGDGLACPSGATRQQSTSEAGHRKVWCAAQPDGPPSNGPMVTTYPDGSVESVQNYLDGERHGPFEAYHHPGGSEGAVGPVWVRGAYATGKKHGPWLSWDAQGQVHQAAVDPEWRDHRPVSTWTQQTAGRAW